METRFGDARRTTDAFFDRIMARTREVHNAVTNTGPRIDQDLLNDIRKWEDELKKTNQQFGVSADVEFAAMS